MATTERVDLYHNDAGFHRADGVLEELAEYRISAVLWERYCKARAALEAVEAYIERSAQKPIVVAPDQEDAFRRAAKPGAWIVVRQPEAVIVPPVEEAVAEVVGFNPPPAPPAPAEEKPKRKRPAACPQRGGLPHTPMRYVITDGMSVYDSGRKRVDGLCQCGERIPDVRCPHQQQTPDHLNRPSCKWCGALIIKAGFVDNRDANGAVDTSKGASGGVPTGFSAGSDNTIIKSAYRVEE